MLALIRKHRWWFAGVTAGAVLLRLFFVWKMRVVTNDSVFYGDIASCILRGHGVAIQTDEGCLPTLSRLPGYPAFLAFSYLLGGENQYVSAMLLQLLLDVCTCILVADIARRAVGERAARIAFLLAAFCPFLMNYVAAALTECAEIFCIAAALDCAMVALESGKRKWWALCGTVGAGAILLRPDGGLILAGIGLPVAALAWREASKRRELAAGLALLGVVSLAPLAPWALRNWRVFHVFQPLVTTHANDPGEFVPMGWERWMRSWVIDYASVQEVAFPVGDETIDPGKIPARAYSSAEQRSRVRELIAQYNDQTTMTPALDAQFGELAAENIRRHPLRYYLLLPAARTADMWLRPRTELLLLDVHFWRFGKKPYDSLCSLALAGLNLAYVGAAIAGAWRLRGRMKYMGLLVAYPVLRTLFLATTGAAEDRYTLECLPFLFVLGAGFLEWWETRRRAG